MIPGYLITINDVTTVNHKKMQFAAFIDANGDWLETAFFPQTAWEYPLRGKGFYKEKLRRNLAFTVSK